MRVLFDLSKLVIKPALTSGIDKETSLPFVVKQVPVANPSDLQASPAYKSACKVFASHLTLFMMLQGFIKEIEVAKLLRHPNILRYYGHRVDGKICNIFLELAARCVVMIAWLCL